MDIQNTALDYFHNGFNCAQSVACAFCPVLGEDMETIFRLTEAFGGGMGCGGTCGAVTAMAVVIGMEGSDGNLKKSATDERSCGRMKCAVEEFERKNRSVMCRDLKDRYTGKDEDCCDGYVKDAVMILKGLLFGNQDFPLQGNGEK